MSLTPPGQALASSLNPPAPDPRPAPPPRPFPALAPVGASSAQACPEWGRHVTRRCRLTLWPASSMAGGALGLRLLLLAALCGAAAGLWPWPRSVQASPRRYRLRPSAFAFRHHGGSAAQPGCDVLDAAFARYRRLLFGAGPWPPPRPSGESPRPAWRPSSSVPPPQPPPGPAPALQPNCPLRGSESPGRPIPGNRGP